MAAPREEKAYEKYAWLIFLFMGLIGFIVAYANLSEGVTATFSDGLRFLVFAVLTTPLSVTGYRTGRK